MKAITEDFLRTELRNTQPDTYYVPEGKILTPAAREYLQQRKIKISAGGKPPEAAPAAAPAASRNERREIFFMMHSSQKPKYPVIRSNCKKGGGVCAVSPPFWKRGGALYRAASSFREIVYRFQAPENRRKGWIS